MSINYELAKALKDAGYPETRKAFIRSEVWVRNIKDNEWYPWDKEPLLELKDHGRSKPFKWTWLSFQRQWDWENYIYIPTLEELIEANKPYLRQITFHSDGTVDAKCGAKSPFPNRIFSSRELDHALTKMYLALNKKVSSPHT